MKYHAIRNTPLPGAGIQALFLLLFQACTQLNLPLGNTEPVTINLPVPHPVLAYSEPGKVPSYSLRWYDARGSRNERHAVTGSITLDLEKGIMTPILLFPETAGTLPGTLPCAGALYPLHSERRNGDILIDTDWEKGISAKLVEEITGSATDGFDTGRLIASHFNWTRFAEKLVLLPSPLDLDRKRICEAVLSGKVTVYDISALETITVSFTALPGIIPENTPFIPAWPGGTGFQWPAGDTIVITAAEGHTCYFCESGVLVFQVEDKKQVCAFFLQYSLQD